MASTGRIIRIGIGTEDTAIPSPSLGSVAGLGSYTTVAGNVDTNSDDYNLNIGQTKITREVVEHRVESAQSNGAEAVTVVRNVIAEIVFEVVGVGPTQDDAIDSHSSGGEWTATETMRALAIETEQAQVEHVPSCVISKVDHGDYNGNVTTIYRAVPRKSPTLDYVSKTVAFS